ncbi:MAG: hypothetical protein IT339_05420 [Thermomicrobiales bacterium]|nr:hypothetical protein [Thermomicrobiales bacterium]
MKDEHEIEGWQPPKGESARPNSSDQGVTFVIVLRFEPSDSRSDANWRWQVRLVETGATGHFWRLADVLAYIAAVSGTPGPH